MTNAKQNLGIMSVLFVILFGIFTTIYGILNIVGTPSTNIMTIIVGIMMIVGGVIILPKNFK